MQHPETLNPWNQQIYVDYVDSFRIKTPNQHKSVIDLSLHVLVVIAMSRLILTSTFEQMKTSVQENAPKP